MELRAPVDSVPAVQKRQIALLAGGGGGSATAVQSLADRTNCNPLEVICAGWVLEMCL